MSQTGCARSVQHVECLAGLLLCATCQGESRTDEQGNMMLEILQFIFQSFWTWLGTLILLIAVIGALNEGMEAIARLWRR